MNSPAKKYLKELKTLIPLHGKFEKKFISDITYNLEEYCMEHNNSLTYQDLCTNFGFPKDLILSYFENCDCDYIVKKLSIKSIIRKLVFTALIIIIIINGMVHYNAYRIYINTMPDHIIETIE